jgi:hypothetical protein
MGDLQFDYDWQRQFTPRMGELIGKQLVIEAPEEEDRRHNTDMLTLRTSDGRRISCRVRRAEQHRWFADEFTIRSYRPSGQPVELDKTLQGWGDWLFYAFAVHEGFEFRAWLIGDLNIFRDWHAGRTRIDGSKWWHTPGVRRWNHDDSSVLTAYGIESLPSRFVVARCIDETDDPAIQGRRRQRRFGEESTQWVGEWEGRICRRCGAQLIPVDFRTRLFSSPCQRCGLLGSLPRQHPRNAEAP